MWISNLVGLRPQSLIPNGGSWATKVLQVLPTLDSNLTLAGDREVHVPVPVWRQDLEKRSGLPNRTPSRDGF
jgi:hypothetical protein